MSKEVVAILQHSLAENEQVRKPTIGSLWSPVPGDVECIVVDRPPRGPSQ
jgi:hypothetical protein